MVSAQLDDIFAQTLSGDYDDDLPWAAVRTLRRLGTREVFDYATGWSRSQNPLKRARAADVLAQLGKTADHPNNSFPDESFSVVSALVQKERDPLPLDSAIHALGHIGNPLAVPIVIEHRLHPSEDVRFAVAFALGKFPDVPIAIEALLALTHDLDEDVRDWATFGVGVLGVMIPPRFGMLLLGALATPTKMCAKKPWSDLGKRKDRRVLSALLGALEQPTLADRAVEVLG